VDAEPPVARNISLQLLLLMQYAYPAIPERDLRNSASLHLPGSLIPIMLLLLECYNEGVMQEYVLALKSHPCIFLDDKNKMHNP